MNDNLRRAVISFVAFAVVCVLGAFSLLAIFAELRFEKANVYQAHFNDVSGLATGDIVRIGGVEVGQVKGISISPEAHAVVEFSADPTVELTEGTKLAIRWKNPIGDRYLALMEGQQGLSRLDPGGTIPIARTEPALDLDVLLGGFRPLFRALDPEQVNALSAQLIEAFQNQGATIGSFLTHAATVTNTLADRDELIGQVITNLDTVLQTFGGQNTQFAKGVDALSELMVGLAERKSDISNAVAYTNAAAATISDLMVQVRPPFKNTMTQLERFTTIVADDHEWFDQFLEGLPRSYQVLSRLGINGDFFTFYLCDLILKLNGKGGQPVYVKMAGQDSGRCSPK